MVAVTRFEFHLWLRLCQQNRREDLVGLASRRCQTPCCPDTYTPEELVAHVRAAHDDEDVELLVFAIRTAAKEWARSHWEHEQTTAAFAAAAAHRAEVSSNRVGIARGVAS